MQPFNYEPVTESVLQEMMLHELISDGSQLPLSPRLTEAGRAEWPLMLRSAIQAGSAHILETALQRDGMLHVQEPSRSARSGFKNVPSNAAAQLAQAEFNRYYMRAVCRKAIAEQCMVEVYRARPSASSRSTSQAMEGQRMLPQILLPYFEDDPYRKDAHLSFGPNSGLSVRLV